ncbi:MAG TPA: hypothetical protein VNL70_07880 [Tepidisphaeraceae bacterium]|nr:hypothetical protein [Tepidisphaeraceae bacterium]
MWYVTTSKPPDWKAAQRYLSRTDPVLRRIIRRVGPCTLAPRRDYFNLLCVSIFNQQISTRIATILYNRFRDQFPRRRPTPPRVLQFLQADGEPVRRCGISRQKKQYLLDLSQRFVHGLVPTRQFWRMSDEQVIESLTQIRGIGQWTAEMFLIFVLNRPDVFPVDDLGLQRAVQRAYHLPRRISRQELIQFGQRWRPWRTVATWYLWRGVEDESD